MKNLINDAHDVIEFLLSPDNPADPLFPQVALELYRAGYGVPAAPGFLKRTTSGLNLPRA